LLVESSQFKFVNNSSFTAGKPRGLRTARKLRVHRREQVWHDKSYKKKASWNSPQGKPLWGSFTR